MNFPDVSIRPEKATEHEDIYNLIRTAFETAQVSDGSEQDFAVKLRQSGGYIPELALVAETDGKLIGHVMLTRTAVNTLPDGERHETLLLAPLSVLLEHRNAGVGKALVSEALQRAFGMGFDSVFLVGNPEYYSRCGFEAVARYGIRPQGDIPERFVLGCELKPGIFSGISGVLECF